MMPTIIGRVVVGGGTEARAVGAKARVLSPRRLRGRWFGLLHARCIVRAATHVGHLFLSDDHDEGSGAAQRREKSQSLEPKTLERGGLVEAI